MHDIKEKIPGTQEHRATHPQGTTGTYSSEQRSTYGTTGTGMGTTGMGTTGMGTTGHQGTL